VGLGAALVQMDKNGSRIISYGSKSLSDVESRYSQTEKEALALVWACEHFHQYLYGLDNFELITDHRPLEVLFTPNSKPSARIERWVMRLQAYKYKVVYQPGKMNIADALSRLLRRNRQKSCHDSRGEEYLRALVQELNPKALRLEIIEEETGKDQILQQVILSLQSGKWEETTKLFHPFANELCEFEGKLLRGTRIVIPEDLRKQTMVLAHEGHPGISAMKQRLRSKVWWPQIDKDAEKWVKECYGCQLVSAADPAEPLCRTTLPQGVWEDIAVDFMGPLPSGHYLLVTVDYYSRYYEVDIMKSITAERTIERLKVIFARFGMPRTIRCDNGPQFDSEDFKTFCRQNDIYIKFSTPLWPQANGEVERQNRSLLKRLKISQAQKTNWREELLNYLTLYRTTPHSTTGCCPGKLMFRTMLRDKIPTLQFREEEGRDGEIRDRDTENKWKGKVYADKTRKSTSCELQEGDTVLMRQQKSNKLSTNYNPEPHRIIERNGSKITVQSITKEQFTLGILRTSRDSTVPSPPRRLLVPSQEKIHHSVPSQNNKQNSRGRKIMKRWREIHRASNRRERGLSE
jgi:transposase InsO family protein